MGMLLPAAPEKVELTAEGGQIDPGREPGDGGLGLVTDSGGLREALVDRAVDLDVPLATLSDDTATALGYVLPETSMPSNPLDCAGPLDETERTSLLTTRRPPWERAAS